MGVRRWRTTAVLGAVALGVSAALTGCSADSDDAGSTQNAQAPAAARPPAGGAAGPAQAGNEGVDKAAQAPAVDVEQRAIVYTGSITVRVEELNQSAAKAAAYAVGAGGFVAADKRNTGTGADDASLTLRVPAAKFTAVVDQLAGLGVEESRGVNTEDVTEETIDVDARIATQTARVNSGRRLLAEAKSLTDLVMLESELAKREADLASLQAKKRRLADITALSTITAVLLDPQAAAQQADDDPAGFLGGLRSGWTALVASLAVLLTVLGALLPWLIALGLPVWGAFWLVRRLRPRAAAAVSPGGRSESGP
jgi:hypothetical protein